MQEPNKILKNMWIFDSCPSNSIMYQFCQESTWSSWHWQESEQEQWILLHFCKTCPSGRTTSLSTVLQESNSLMRILGNNWDFQLFFLRNQKLASFIETKTCKLHQNNKPLKIPCSSLIRFSPHKNKTHSHTRRERHMALQCYQSFFDSWSISIFNFCTLSFGRSETVCVSTTWISLSCDDPASSKAWEMSESRLAEGRSCEAKYKYGIGVNI